ncbi:MAG TPA: hypothetical protein VMW27_27315 [Thermoanaerobaculia bacterium]|nr:hypothetical protein [Thermoanaerobaculia bacterium]
MEKKVYERPLLYYSETCPRCRLLSRIVGWLSLDTLRRVPMDYWEAVDFYRENPRYAGKLVLFHDRGVTVGGGVFLAVPWLIVKTWLGAARVAA